MRLPRRLAHFQRAGLVEAVKSEQRHQAFLFILA
jgi:hypothetical protein